MADAVAAFSEAFSSYRKSFGDYLIYSLLMSVASGAMALILLAMIIVSSAITVGGITSLSSGTSALSFNTFGLGVALILLVIGLLVFGWVASGLNGTYLHTLSMFLGGRKQTIGGFIGGIPRIATPVFIVGILTAIIIGIPAAAIILIFSAAKGMVAILGIAIGAAYALIMSLLLVFAVPAAIVDNKGALAAVKHSISIVPRNLVGVIIFLVICAVLAIPSFTIIYVPLVYMPVSGAALLALYKRSR